MPRPDDESPRDRRQRLDGQFPSSGEGGGEAQALWRSLGLVLDTNRFLNIGYTPPYLPILVGSPQRRLAIRLARQAMGYTQGGVERPLLVDLGCGRGGPAISIARRFDVPVLGIDAVMDNVVLARENGLGSSITGTGVAFAAGDVLTLPVVTDAAGLCLAIDVTPYLGDRGQLFGEVRRVLADDGVFGFSDLVWATPDGSAPTKTERRAFRETWGFPPLPVVDDYPDLVEEAGLTVLESEDISNGSIRRLEKWAGAYLVTSRTPMFPFLRRAVERLEVDLDTVTDRVARTAPVLSDLRHVVYYCRP